jgi:nitronate monooxygenase
MKTLPSLQIGKYTARYPIVQGAMAVRVSGGNLAGAVAQAGGIGVVATLGLGLHSSFCDRYAPRRQKYQFFIANRLALIDELQKARAISPDGLIGVNVLVATKNYPDLVRTAVEQGANLIIAGAGLPLDLPEYTADYPDVALVPIVSTVSAAASICQHWQRYYHRLPDALIAECPRSSGGLGATSEEMDESTCQVERIVPELVDYLRHQFGSSIPVIASGGIWNRCLIQALDRAARGDVENGLVFAGTKAGRTKRIMPVAELMAELTL